MLIAATGCKKQQPGSTETTKPSTAEQRPATQEVAGARTESEEADTKPERILDEANTVLSSVQDPVRQTALSQWLSQARAVLIFPSVRKAALVLGGRGGRGVMLTKQSDGSFGSPAFYSIGGGSVGLQIGYEKTGIVLFLMNDKATNAAMNGGFDLGADASVAMGTITDSGAAASGVAGADVVSVTLDNNGVFLGASVNGAVISPNEKLNEGHYHSTDVRSILTTNRFLTSHPATISKTLDSMAMTATKSQGQSQQQGTSTKSGQSPQGSTSPKR